MEKLISEFIQEASRGNGMAARMLLPEGAPMSGRAMVGTLQETVNRLNEIVADMRNEVGRKGSG